MCGPNDTGARIRVRAVVREPGWIWMQDVFTFGRYTSRAWMVRALGWQVAVVRYQRKDGRWWTRGIRRWWLTGMVRKPFMVISLVLDIGRWALRLDRMARRGRSP